MEVREFIFSRGKHPRYALLLVSKLLELVGADPEPISTDNPGQPHLNYLRGLYYTSSRSLDTVLNSICSELVEKCKESRTILMANNTLNLSTLQATHAFYSVVKTHLELGCSSVHLSEHYKFLPDMLERLRKEKEKE